MPPGHWYLYQKAIIINNNNNNNSLAWPDSLRTGAYRLEIISAALRESGIVNSTQIKQCPLRLGGQVKRPTVDIMIEACGFCREATDANPSS